VQVLEDDESFVPGARERQLMAYDLLSGKNDGRDWSLGAGWVQGAAAADLPRRAQGYAPETNWRPAEMEAWIADRMTKRLGLFGIGPKPTRAEAVAELVKHMRANKIGPMDVSGWTAGDHTISDQLSSEMGSLLLPAAQQRAMLNKIDDVRFDVRKAGAAAGKGLLVLGAGIALLGFAQVYRTARGR
jgi:hypothetical protein